jgi:hypothetical protein
LGHSDEAGFVEDGVFAESAVEGAAEAGCEGLVVQGAGDVALVEESDDLVFEMLACGEL